MDRADAMRAPVLDHSPCHNWVCFTCHKTAATNLFDPALLLHNHDTFNLNDIIRPRLPNAKFVLLAAFHTVEQSEIGLPNEILHLAGAMQFSGFRSVIGTLCAMGNKDGPKIARWFYEEVLEGDNNTG